MKFGFKSPHTLDLKIAGKTIHGNYQASKAYNLCINYIAKKGNYKTTIPNLDKETNKMVVKGDKHLKNIEKFGTRESVQMVIKEKGGSIFKEDENILTTMAKSKMVEELSNIQATQVEKPKYSLEEFKLNAQLNYWIKALLNKEKYLPTLFMIGETRSGKSQFVYALLHYANLCTFMTNDVNGLKNSTPKHEAIFFDDLKIKKHSDDELLALLETEYERKVDVKYDTVSKKKNLVQIVSINFETAKKAESIIKQPIILSRIALVIVEKSIIKTEREIEKEKSTQININFNVQVNNYNINQTQTQSIQKENTTSQKEKDDTFRTEYEKFLKRENKKAVDQLDYFFCKDTAEKQVEKEKKARLLRNIYNELTEKELEKERTLANKNIL